MVIKVEVGGKVYEWTFSDLEEENDEPYKFEESE